MPQPIEKFMSLVLPHQGSRILVEFVNGTPHHHVYEEGTSVEEIANDARAMDKRGRTVYMAMGGYARGTVAKFKGRTAENSRWFRSFWFDLDVGEAENKYPTVKDAADALSKFINAVGLPHPTVVHSGYGLHVYWPLLNDVEVTEWRAIALRFKALADSQGLKIDSTCTQDAARILRPIGTHNYKHVEPREVRLIQSAGAVELTAIQRYLAQLPAIPAVLPLVKSNGHHTADAFGLGSIDKSRPEDFNARKIIAGCQQFAWANTHQDQVQEPMWRAMIGTLYRTDTPEIIHQFSNKHPGYTSGETEAKAKAWIGGGVTCATLESLRPGGCIGCPKYGAIKSPSWFGMATPAEPAPPKIDVMTGMPETWVVRGGTLCARTEDGFALLYNGLIEFGQPFKEKDPTSRNDIQFLPIRAKTALDQHELFLHMGTHASVQELKKAFSTVGIVPEVRQEKEFLTGMRAWIQKITDESTSVKPVRQMGWQSHEFSDVGAGFVLGTTLYTPGKKQQVRIDSAAEKHSRHMKPEGSYDEWKRAINVYNRPEYRRYALMSWLMFGAPLGRLLGVGLPIAHFNSQGSGHGKTGTQDLLLSGAGNPRDPNGRWTGNTTIISIYAYLTAMNGNIAVLDETSAIAPETLGKLMFEATLGSGRKAMAGSSGQTRDLPPITGLLCTSGNVSLQQLAQTMKGNSEAQVARVFEFNVQRPELSTEQRFADAEIFKKVYDNYGHAMPIFIEYVVNHQVLVKHQLAMVEKKIIEQLGMNNEERFWRALLVVCVTGALIAKKLGIIDHDVNALIPAALEHFDYQRAAVREEAKSGNPIYQYVQDNQQAVLVVDSDKPTITSTGIHVVTAIRKPAAHVNIRMRYVTDSGRLYVDRKHLRSYCSEMNYDFRQVLADAAKGGWLIADQERRDLAAFTSLDTPARVMCTVFDMVRAKAVADLLTGA